MVSIVVVEVFDHTLEDTRFGEMMASIIVTYSLIFANSTWREMFLFVYKQTTQSSKFGMQIWSNVLHRGSYHCNEYI